MEQVPARDRAVVRGRAVRRLLIAGVGLAGGCGAVPCPSRWLALPLLFHATAQVALERALGQQPRRRHEHEHLQVEAVGCFEAEPSSTGLTGEVHGPLAGSQAQPGLKVLTGRVLRLKRS